MAFDGSATCPLCKVNTCVLNKQDAITLTWGIYTKAVVFFFFSDVLNTIFLNYISGLTMDLI